jgi:hypothetical protein
VVETATVVGPPGEEIHVDEHGRVKVQFHWDREGQRDEHSSCWLRAMQPWAGAAWGSQFILRVGMEVVVTFVGGDIDRPMVLGAVPNAQNPMPYLLPGQKTRSGIKTRTSPGGGGSNELRFEDAAGQEQVFLHAQKDLDAVVENNHTRTVRGDEAMSVARTSKVEIGGDQEVSIGGNEVVTINKNLVLHVVGRQIIHVDGQGAADGGGPGATPPGPEAVSPIAAGAAGTMGGSEALSEEEVLGDQEAAATLSLFRAQVPEEFHAQATALVDAVAGAARQVAAVGQEALEAEGEEGLDGAARLAGVVAQAREVRDVIGQTITDALQPMPEAMHRLQVAAVERLQTLWRRADGMEKGLRRGALGSTNESGSARGGGGADVKPFTPHTPKGLPSTLQITNGRGIIDAPDGLLLMAGDASSIELLPDSITLTRGGSTITIKDAEITIHSKTVNITGDSVIKCEGGEIYLN